MKGWSFFYSNQNIPLSQLICNWVKLIRNWKCFETRSLISKMDSLCQQNRPGFQNNNVSKKSSVSFVSKHNKIWVKIDQLLKANKETSPIILKNWVLYLCSIIALAPNDGRNNWCTLRLRDFDFETFRDFFRLRDQKSSSAKARWHCLEGRPWWYTYMYI